MIENGLTPVMALRACLYPCHKSCFYRYLHHIPDTVIDVREQKIVDEYKKKVEVIENNEIFINNTSLSTRRKLFSSPHSLEKSTSMVSDVIEVDDNSNDKTILSQLTDDSFIEYHSKMFSTNTSFKIKYSWWNIKLKDIFSKSNDIATSISLI